MGVGSPPGPVIATSLPGIQLGVTFMSYCLHWSVASAMWVSLPPLEKKQSKIMRKVEHMWKGRGMCVRYIFVYACACVRLGYASKCTTHVCLKACVSVHRHVRVCVRRRSVCLPVWGSPGNVGFPLQHQR